MSKTSRQIDLLLAKKEVEMAPIPDFFVYPVAVILGEREIPTPVPFLTPLEIIEGPLQSAWPCGIVWQICLTIPP